MPRHKMIDENGLTKDDKATLARADEQGFVDTPVPGVAKDHEESATDHNIDAAGGIVPINDSLAQEHNREAKKRERITHKEEAERGKTASPVKTNPSLAKAIQTAANSGRAEMPVVTRETLKGENLSGRNFTKEFNRMGEGAKHIGHSSTDFTNADLSNSVMQGVNLQGAVFKGANLKGADLTGADCRWAHFEGAKIDETTKFDDANLIEAAGVADMIYG